MKELLEDFRQKFVQQHPVLPDLKQVGLPQPELLPPATAPATQPPCMHGSRGRTPTGAFAILYKYKNTCNQI